MSQQISNDQEIDLNDLFKKIKIFFHYIIDKIFDFIFFLKRNIFFLALLLIVGVGIGYFLDKGSKSYANEIIVTPNFGSVNYLYGKIDLLAAKKRDNDTLFFKNLGFKNISKVKTIDIEPIVDVYAFIDKKPENFEMLKLMAENGDLNKIIEDPTTSKKYPYHSIRFSTSQILAEGDIVQPLLKFLNDSDYYNQIKNQYVKNQIDKKKYNDSIIFQIDGLINNFASVSASKSDKLFYNNENNQISEIIAAKNNLLRENAEIELGLLTSNTVIKHTSIVTNLLNAKNFYLQLKFVLPIVLLSLFLIGSFFNKIYRNQLNKRKTN